jgi:diguanylate cyclase (GGDEF)-like protein
MASLVALLAFVTPASAATGLVGTPVPVCIAAVLPGDTPAAMLDDSARFDCTSRQTDLGPGDYWVRSKPLAAAGPLAVRSASLWQKQATLWTAYADGPVAQRSYDGTALARTIQLGAIVEMPLATRAAPVTRLLWRIDGAANLRGVVLGAALATPAQSAASNLRLAALYGAFGGLCVALFLYNLALWTAQRQGFQLAYCAMLLALGTYAFSSSGALAWLWPDLPNNMRLRVNYLTLAASAVGALAFARSFFEERVFRGWLSRLIYLVSAAVMGSAIVFVVATDWQIVILDRIYAFSFVIATLVSGPILWQARRQQSRYLNLFAYAWALPIMLAAVRVAGNFNVIAWSFLLDNSTLVAMTAEALLSSLAIAYRTRLVALERDQAREQEGVARQLADRDPLTGLLNRRAFLREAIGWTGERQLAIVDIDHFKSVNETLGHDGGDEVLRLVARVLRQLEVSGTLVARMGGEEFALVPPVGSNIDTERLLDAIRDTRMPLGLRVTASLGASQGSLASDSDWERLYHAADQALFAAKAAGRDQARTTQRADARSALPLAA